MYDKDTDHSLIMCITVSTIDDIPTVARILFFNKKLFFLSTNSSFMESKDRLLFIDIPGYMEGKTTVTFMTGHTSTSR